MVLRGCSYTSKVLNMYKRFSYATIYSSAEMVSTEHMGTMYFGQFCNRNGLRESLGKPQSPYGALLSTPREDSGTSELVCVQQLPLDSLQGCSKSLPGEKLSKLVKYFTVKAVGVWPSTSHISPLNQASPIPYLCRSQLRSSWSPQGMND